MEGEKGKLGSERGEKKRIEGGNKGTEGDKRGERRERE